MPRQYCHRCTKPQVACICDQLSPQNNNIAVIVLQHPDEKNKAIGTAAIITLNLTNAKLISGLHIPELQVNNALKEMGCARPLLVYPKALSDDVQHYVHDFEKDHPTSEPLKNNVDSIILLDGTWRNTRELIICNEWIKTLPTLQLENAGESQYRIRQAQTSGALATIEAVSKVLEVMDVSFEAERFLKPFEKMIEFQISRMGPDIYKQNYLQG